jgi:hypothetical protein
MNLFLIALIAACAADIATTAMIVKAGGRETNYLPAALMKKFGLWPVMLVTKGIIIGVGVLLNQPGYYVVAAALNLAAAAWNLAHRAK